MRTNITEVVSNINRTVELARQIRTTIRAFVSSHKDAPRQLHSIASELRTTIHVLTELRSFLARSAIFNAHSNELIEETIKSMASCDNRLRELGKIVIRVCGFGILGGSKVLMVQWISVGVPGGKMGLLWKMAWLLRERKVVEAIERGMQGENSKLTMMLNMFNAHAPTTDGIQRCLNSRVLSTTTMNTYSPLTDPDSEDYEFDEVLWLSSVYQRLCPELNQRHLAINSKDSIGTWSIYPESEMSHIAVLRVPLGPRP